MKPIFILIKNFKNLLPYFLLIALYFFFINLETRKEKINNKIIEVENIRTDIKLSTIFSEKRSLKNLLIITKIC